MAHHETYSEVSFQFYYKVSILNTIQMY